VSNPVSVDEEETSERSVEIFLFAESCLLENCENW